MGASNRITWQNIVNPDFSGAVAAQESAAKAMDRAFNRISTGIDNFDNFRKDNADAAYLKNMLAYQDPKALQQAMTSGALMQGVNPDLVRAGTMMKAQKQVGDLLENASKQQTYDQNEVMNPLLVNAKQLTNEGADLTNKQTKLTYDNSVENDRARKVATDLYQSNLVNGKLADRAGANRTLAELTQTDPTAAIQYRQLIQQQDPSFGAPAYVQAGAAGIGGAGGVGGAGGTTAAGPASLGSVKAPAGATLAPGGVSLTGGAAPAATNIPVPKYTRNAETGYTPEGVPAFTRVEGRAPTAQDMRTRATQLGVDPALAEAVFAQESSGNWGSKDSTKGAKGGMQVMPDTFKQMMGTSGNENNPWDNMEAGLRYLAHVSEVTGSRDPRIIAAGYHSGPNRAGLKMGIIDPQLNDGAKYTADYANDIVKRMAAAGQTGVIPSTGLPGVDQLDVAGSRAKVQSQLASAAAGSWQQQVAKAFELGTSGKDVSVAAVVNELTTPAEKGQGGGVFAGMDKKYLTSVLIDTAEKMGTTNYAAAAEIIKSSMKGKPKESGIGKIASMIGSVFSADSDFNAAAIEEKIQTFKKNEGKAFEDAVVSTDAIRLNREKQANADAVAEAKRQQLVAAKRMVDNGEFGSQAIYEKALADWNEAQAVAMQVKRSSDTLLRGVNGTEKAPDTNAGNKVDDALKNAAKTSAQATKKQKIEIKREYEKVKDEVDKLTVGPKTPEVWKELAEKQATMDRLRQEWIMSKAAY